MTGSINGVARWLHACGGEFLATCRSQTRLRVGLGTWSCSEADFGGHEATPLYGGGSAGSTAGRSAPAAGARGLGGGAAAPEAARKSLKARGAAKAPVAAPATAKRQRAIA